MGSYISRMRRPAPAPGSLLALQGSATYLSILLKCDGAVVPMEEYRRRVAEQLKVFAADCNGGGEVSSTDHGNCLFAAVVLNGAGARAENVLSKRKFVTADGTVLWTSLWVAHTPPLARAGGAPSLWRRRAILRRRRWRGPMIATSGSP